MAVAITVTLIGLLLATATGIIGASVVLLALLELPVMLSYDERLATGTVCCWYARHTYPAQYYACPNG